MLVILRITQLLQFGVKHRFCCFTYKMARQFHVKHGLALLIMTQGGRVTLTNCLFLRITQCDFFRVRASGNLTYNAVRQI